MRVKQLQTHRETTNETILALPQAIMTITTTDDLKEYLQFNGVEFDTIEELSGGTANFVWRVKETSGRSTIIKHAEPFVKNNANMPFPVDRMNFEARALKDIPLLLPTTDGLVHPPELYHYDDANHVMMMADGGTRNLKAAYTDESLDVLALGKALGTWIASLHRETVKTDIGDSVTAKMIYRHAYRNLASALEKYGFDPSLGEQINEEYGSLLQTDNISICHGDFWPGNVLPSNKGLTVVDWEMVRRGCGATDVGQFAAESYLLDRFRGQRGLLPVFLKSYAKVAKPDKAFVKRIAVHFGTHIAYWPTRVEWGTDEETKELVRFGSEVIRRAVDEDWEWLTQSPLGDVISE
jgi:tRNA A-37 threonylcarbamoyl transferase component Bud32